MKPSVIASVHLNQIGRPLKIEVYTATPGDRETARDPYPILTIEGITFFGDLDDMRAIHDKLGAYLGSTEAARANRYRRDRDAEK